MDFSEFFKTATLTFSGDCICNSQIISKTAVRGGMLWLAKIKAK